ncbi:MAG: nitroreductase family deazaflavin-dependent oxidoreductase [Candidatus Binatus sp.]|uniref:nitroreductase family deazaflavin-dependent oxidoreductase n=1 Tax=Candidatus Binatus sp. TaxID=2811406 RepID=UPI0027267DB3|nr:nitroreductase family deazaflavin-dependent oxidoreductase [Candidatus Binatus sp.]MDO8432623.1 nitroreductase family deazaflavin-dependent oxidoreductase [Candidatus Binatus sp.]
MNERHEFNRKIIEEFRANAGKVGGMFANAPMILITTTGAKSGQARTTPLVYSKDGDRYVIIASMAGAPNNPDWYHNLKTHPTATVEIGAEKFKVKAGIATGDDRERLYNQQAALLPMFNDYRKKTTRQIPVFVLERVA